MNAPLGDPPTSTRAVALQNKESTRIMLSLPKRLADYARREYLHALRYDMPVMHVSYCTSNTHPLEKLSRSVTSFLSCPQLQNRDRDTYRLKILSAGFFAESSFLKTCYYLRCK